MTWILVLLPVGPLTGIYLGGYTSIDACREAGTAAMAFRSEKIAGYNGQQVWRDFTCLPGPGTVACTATPPVKE